MIDELKPCPRCKSKNVFWRDGAYHNFKIKCENCGLETPECNLDGAIQFETYEGARDWWNHRHEPDTLPECVIKAIEYIRTQTACDTHEHNLVQYWLNYIEKRCKPDMYER